MIPFFMARRRRRRFDAPRRFQQLRFAVEKVLWLALLVALTHVAAMMAFEDLTMREAVWLTATTMVTVGYGDVSAKTPLGQLSTMVLLYAAGIFLAAQAASAWFDYRAARREAMSTGEWDWKALASHVVVVAPGRVGELFLRRLVAELDQHEATRGRDVVIVSDEFGEGLPGSLAAGEVRLVTGYAQDPESLTRAGVPRCSHVVILADNPDATVSDGLTFDVVSRVRELNAACEVIAQCVDDRNRARLRTAGANALARPVRAYPEMLITGLLYPGCIDVMENLFTGAGERIALVRGPFKGTWASVVGDMLSRDAGLPIAARLADGTVLTAPRATQSIDAEALYVMVSA